VVIFNRPARKAQIELIAPGAEICVSVFSAQHPIPENFWLKAAADSPAGPSGVIRRRCKRIASHSDANRVWPTVLTGGCRLEMLPREPAHAVGQQVRQHQVSQLQTCIMRSQRTNPIDREGPWRGGSVEGAFHSKCTIMRRRQEPAVP
jgi:hypothetical protein